MHSKNKNILRAYVKSWPKIDIISCSSDFKMIPSSIKKAVQLLETGFSFRDRISIVAGLRDRIMEGV